MGNNRNWRWGPVRKEEMGENDGDNLPVCQEPLVWWP